MSVCQCSSPKHNADVLNVLWSITLFRPCSAFFPPAPSCYSTQHQTSNYSFQLASLLSSTQLIIGLLGLPISGLFTNQQNSRSKLFHHITPLVLLFDNLIVSFCLILFCGCGKSRFSSSSSSLWFPFSSNYRGLPQQNVTPLFSKQSLIERPLKWQPWFISINHHQYPLAELRRRTSGSFPFYCHIVKCPHIHLALSCSTPENASLLDWFIPFQIGP